jgi:class 3 adenylate cyclase
MSATNTPAAMDVLPPGERIAAVLFADVVGFSKFSDVEVEHFVRDFLYEVGAFVDETPFRPVYKNTWGDGLYFQFLEIRAAGLFALALTSLVSNTDWTTHGLPSTLSLRCGLHAGPLFAYRDAVTGQDCLWGRHVTRAARIEPVTPPGSVYASHEFAALSAAQGITDFECESVGRVGLAKAYGEARLYHVRRHFRPIVAQVRAP